MPFSTACACRRSQERNLLDPILRDGTHQLYQGGGWRRHLGRHLADSCVHPAQLSDRPVPAEPGLRQSADAYMESWPRPTTRASFYQLLAFYCCRRLCRCLKRLRDRSGHYRPPHACCVRGHSKAVATRQPSFSAPMRFLVGSTTSSKNSGQKCEPPVTSFIGLTVTPLLRIGMYSIESPACFGTSRLVLHSTIA